MCLRWLLVLQWDLLLQWMSFAVSRELFAQTLVIGRGVWLLWLNILVVVYCLELVEIGVL